MLDMLSASMFIKMPFPFTFRPTAINFHLPNSCIFWLLIYYYAQLIYQKYLT